MRSQNEPPHSMQRDLADEIHHLTEYLKVVHSTRRRFWYGLIGGIGGVIGATIIAAPLLYGLSRALSPLGVDFPPAP